MILTCPACSTRYEVDGAKFPAAGRQVRCAKCSHVWHQPGPDAESAPAIVETQLDPAPEAAQDAAAESAKGEPVSRVRAQMQASAAAASATPSAPRQPILPLIGIILGWIGLIAIVLLIGLSAVRYRQEITVIWPQSAGVYSKLGMPVNTRGIDFAHVDYHRENEDGQIVLAVTGQIINNGGRELPVPQNLRVTLSDASQHELYHWNFPSSVLSLKPGETAPFTTRLSSPPAGARHLDVRFAPPDK